MTLEESKEEFLKELNKTNQLIFGAYKNAVERLNKETQELKEQNAELVEIVFAIHATLTNGVSIQPKTPLLPMMKELLTKHNHLNKSHDSIYKEIPK